MSILRCKSCGGALNIEESLSVVQCEYCGLKQTIPRLDDEKLTEIFDRANFYRSKNEFDKAAIVYGNIIVEKKNEAEAYWGLCLCRYGIEYVTDPATGNKIPTCHRTQFKSILDDDDYKKAIENADVLSRQVYEKEAQYIDKVQKEILSVSSKEEPFDIFICYKETDEHGQRTVDSVLAQDIYTKLTKTGYKVFFARITLEDKIGTAYEPYIFAALNSAKVMLVVGTTPINFNAVWVKNEWSRYIKYIEQGKEKTLVPCYKDMSPYELPEEFVSLQSQDLGKVGAMQDLIRGIEKICNISVVTPKETTTTNNFDVSSLMEGNANSILRRGYISLEDGEFNNAKDYFNKCLNMNPESSAAYWGLVLAGDCSRNDDELAQKGKKIRETNEYKNALRFANTSERKQYEDIKNRILAKIDATVNALKKKKILTIEETQIKQDLELSEKDVEQTKTKLTKLLKDLNSIEEKIKTYIELCKKQTADHIKKVSDNVLAAKKLAGDIRKFNKITDEEKQMHINVLNEYRTNMTMAVDDIKNIKNKSDEFGELKKLTNERDSIIVEINNLKKVQLDDQKSKCMDYIIKINNIIKEHDEAINNVYLGDYRAADAILG